MKSAAMIAPVRAIPDPTRKAFWKPSARAAPRARTACRRVAQSSACPRGRSRRPGRAGPGRADARHRRARRARRRHPLPALPHEGRADQGDHGPTSRTQAPRTTKVCGSACCVPRLTFPSLPSSAGARERASPRLAVASAPLVELDQRVAARRPERKSLWATRAAPLAALRAASGGRARTPTAAHW